MFYTKIYRVQGEVIVAICDKELLGKRFEEGEIVIDVKKDFYGGSLIGRDDAIRLLEEGTIINLVGKKIVSIAIEIGLVDKENVLVVKDVPHAQVYKI